MRNKYTKELLEQLVKESTSVIQIIRKLGLKEAGGTHTHLSNKIKKFEIDTSHFLGRGSNCGKNHKGGTNKKTYKEILIKKEKGNRQKSFVLRRSLIEAGRNYICEVCQLLPIWEGKILILQVDHKNGNWLDNTKENLRFICPNCHTQTIGFCGSKGYFEVTSRNKTIRELRKIKNEKMNIVKKDAKIKKQTDPLWRTKPKSHLRKVERPDLETLLKEVKEQNYSTVGKKYGVSDNCIRKWIKYEQKQMKIGK